MTCTDQVSGMPVWAYHLTPEIEQGCQQIMSPDPDSTETCPDPLFCLTCGSCEDHCHCEQSCEAEGKRMRYGGLVMVSGVRVGDAILVDGEREKVAEVINFNLVRTAYDDKA